MERLIFQARYERDIVLDGAASVFDYRRSYGGLPKESILFDAKEFAEFMQIDTDIFENEREIIIRFYVHSNLSFFDLAKGQMERLISRCDAMRFRDVKSYVYDCIIELYFSKTSDKTVEIGEDRQE